MNKHFLLCVIFASGVAAPLNQFKVPPLMHQMMDAFDLSLAASGWLMSLFALVGFVFALPAGQIIKKTGLKIAGVIALSALLAGSVLGGLAWNLPAMIISRIIEGVGLCLIAVTGPAAIALLFPPEKRGVPMGIWATWVPVGTIIMFTLAPILGVWQNAWLFTSIYTALALLLFIICFSVPEARFTQAEKQTIYKNKDIWLLAFVFMLYNIAVIAVKTYVPVFMEEERGLSPLKASTLTSLIMFFSLATAPAWGFLSDVTGSRKLLFVGGIALFACATAPLFFVGIGFITLSLVIIGISCGAVPAMLFSSVPDIVGAQQTGTGLSITAFGQNAGMFAGPVLFSFFAGNTSWQVAGLTMAGILVFACFLASRLRISALSPKN